MINEIRQEINLSPDLEKKINWAVKYASIKVKVQKGALIRLEPTNMAYLEPHKIEINNYVFLFLNLLFFLTFLLHDGLFLLLFLITKTCPYLNTQFPL